MMQNDAPDPGRKIEFADVGAALVQYTRIPSKLTVDVPVVALMRKPTVPMPGVAVYLVLVLVIVLVLDCAL